MQKMSANSQIVRMAPLRLPSDVVIRTSSRFDTDLEQLKTETDPQKRLKIIADLLRKYQSVTSPYYATHPTGSHKKQKTEELEDEVRKELQTFEGPLELVVQIVKLLAPKELEMFAQVSKNALGAVLTFYAMLTTEELFKLLAEVFLSPGDPRLFWHALRQRWYESLVALVPTPVTTKRKLSFFPPTYGDSRGPIQLHITLDAISAQLIRTEGFVNSLFTDESPGVIHKLLFFHECIATDFFNYRKGSVIDRKVFDEHVKDRIEVVRLYKTAVIKLLCGVLKRMMVAANQRIWTRDANDDLEFLLRFLALFPPELPTDDDTIMIDVDTISTGSIREGWAESTLWASRPEEMMISIVKVPVARMAVGPPKPFWSPTQLGDISSIRTYKASFEWSKPTIFEMIQLKNQPTTAQNPWKPVSIFHCLFQRGSMHPGSWRRTPKEVLLPDLHSSLAYIYEPKEAMRAVLRQLLEMLEILKELRCLEQLEFRSNGEILMHFIGSEFAGRPFNITPYTRAAGITAKGSLDPSFLWHRQEADNDWFVREVRLLGISVRFSTP